MEKLILLRSSIGTIVGLVVHYVCFYIFHSPLWTDAIAEWIMARTPSRYAVPLLEILGPWAKPFAATGALASLGFGVLLIALADKSIQARVSGRVLTRAGFIAALTTCVALAYEWSFEFHSIAGQLSFWFPAALAILALHWTPGTVNSTSAIPSRDREGSVLLHQRSRRQSLVMVSGVAAVALESFLRNRLLASRAGKPTNLDSMPVMTSEEFAPGLVRKAITPVSEFYGMSKNTVDPLTDPSSWRLKLTQDGKLLREFSYSELLAIPRFGRFVTLRCVSNTLKSDLMGTAYWSGIHLSQIAALTALPSSIVEAAILGVDGHGDSVPLDYAFSSEPLLALAMNGQTLSRDHGFPIRLLAPRYYGFKNVKWISEIAFLSQPYFGTWPKLGYTKEPIIHTVSHIDRHRIQAGHLVAGGVSFAGIRGIQAVEVRADRGPWIKARLERPLSQYTWTRWFVELPIRGAHILEVRARDGAGVWQSNIETPIFPNGMDGPTRLTLPT